MATRQDAQVEPVDQVSDQVDAPTDETPAEQVFDIAAALAEHGVDGVRSMIEQELATRNAYLAAAPGTPIADALAAHRDAILAARRAEDELLGIVAPTPTTSNGGSRSNFDAAHAAEWLAAKHAAGSKGNKWPLIQAYRAEGYSAQDTAFFDLVKAEWA